MNKIKQNLYKYKDIIENELNKTNPFVFKGSFGYAVNDETGNYIRDENGDKVENGVVSLIETEAVNIIKPAYPLVDNNDIFVSNNSLGVGVAKLDLNYKVVDESVKYGSSSVPCNITIDADNNIILADGSEFIVLDKNNLSNELGRFYYRTDQSFSNPIRSLLTDNGNLIFSCFIEAGGTGFIVQENNGGVYSQKASYSSTFGDQMTSLIKSSSGSIYAGQSQGIEKLSTDGETIVASYADESGALPGSLAGVLELPDGNIAYFNQNLIVILDKDLNKISEMPSDGYVSTPMIGSDENIYVSYFNRYRVYDKSFNIIDNINIDSRGIEGFVLKDNTIAFPSGIDFEEYKTFNVNEYIVSNKNGYTDSYVIDDYGDQLELDSGDVALFLRPVDVNGVVTPQLPEGQKYYFMKTTADVVKQYNFKIVNEIDNRDIDTREGSSDIQCLFSVDFDDILPVEGFNATEAGFSVKFYVPSNDFLAINDIVKQYIVNNNGKRVSSGKEITIFDFSINPPTTLLNVNSVSMTSFVLDIGLTIISGGSVGNDVKVFIGDENKQNYEQIEYSIFNTITLRQTPSHQFLGDEFVDKSVAVGKNIGFGLTALVVDNNKIYEIINSALMVDENSLSPIKSLKIEDSSNPNGVVNTYEYLVIFDQVTRSLVPGTMQTVDLKCSIARTPEGV